MSEIIIDIAPMPKPRMTRRDKLASTRTKQASKYFKWKNDFIWLCKEAKFSISTSVPNIVFEFAIPKSYSKARKNYLLGKQHDVKPDIDNCLKSILDSICPKDQKVSNVGTMKKVWAEKSRIIFIE